MKIFGEKMSKLGPLVWSFSIKNFLVVKIFFRYQKYLYDFECERENLSTPSELQQAIEGNKREGRRTGHGSGNGSSLNGGLGGSSSGLILSATGSGCGSAGTSANPFTFPFSTPHSAAAAAAAANSFLGKHLNGAFGLRKFL